VEKAQAATPVLDNRKLLRPFVKASWESDTVGRLVITGDPRSGQLQASAGSAAQPAGPRIVRVHHNTILLEGTGSAPLKLLADQSHAGSRAVWGGPAGEREVWQPLQRSLARATSSSSVAGAAAPAVSLGVAVERLFRAGNEAMVCGRFEEAAKHYTAALDSGGGRAAEALRDRAQANVALRNPMVAVADANSAVALEPENHLGYQVLGLALFAAGDYDSAREAYLAALRRASGCTRALLAGPLGGRAAPVALEAVGAVLPDLQRHHLGAQASLELLLPQTDGRSTGTPGGSPVCTALQVPHMAIGALALLAHRPRSSGCQQQVRRSRSGEALSVDRVPAQRCVD